MKLRPSFTCLLLLAAALSSAVATTVIPPNFDKLVNHADVIFQGEVTDVQSRWIGEGAEHRITTFVTFKVEDAIKGAPGATYTIRMLGGTVNGQTLEVTDAPKFKVGDRDILFVENNGKQFIPLVGIKYGRMHLERDNATGTDVLMTGDGVALNDVAQLGPKSGVHAETSAKAKPMTPAALKAAVRAKLQTGQ